MQQVLLYQCKEKNCFTTLSCDIKTHKMKTFFYLLLVNTIPWRHNHKIKQWKNNKNIELLINEMSI